MTYLTCADFIFLYGEFQNPLFPWLPCFRSPFPPRKAPLPEDDSSLRNWPKNYTTLPTAYLLGGKGKRKQLSKQLCDEPFRLSSCVWKLPNRQGLTVTVHWIIATCMLTQQRTSIGPQNSRLWVRSSHPAPWSGLWAPGLQTGLTTWTTWRILTDSLSPKCWI